MHGEANATVTIKVFEYSATDPDFYVLINDVEKELDDTFTVHLADDGNGSFTVWLSPLNHDDHGTINISLQIIATSTGTIGTPDFKGYRKTV